MVANEVRHCVFACASNFSYSTSWTSNAFRVQRNFTELYGDAVYPTGHTIIKINLT
ncbi:hypothetical protein KIN20_019601 [Parelaphostrongylus tenuis]|uniref:Uncharacterized protein n=1 Tax=Parelaphostrongylus tenuis TaxID=148309 RepID=A0AAD5QQ97_PARTN|nr:hypothetical protein KIN20_019601 [Parelaphostrongylus tenuis]